MSGTAQSSISEVRRDVFRGGSEMARLMREFDWSSSPLGPVEQWSPVLRSTIRVMLANRFPHILWWGPQFIQFYNDAYIPVPGSKHPQRVLGRPGSECWAEIWPVIGPLVERPFGGGEATWDEDITLLVHRHGFLEESHFTIAYSPVPDDSAPNGIGGVIATVNEITGKVLGERRVSALRDIGAQTVNAKSVEEACELAAGSLAAHDRDVPFALLYLTAPDGRSATLAGQTPFDCSREFAPATIDLTDAAAPWAFAEVGGGGEIRLVEGLGARFTGGPRGPWPTSPDKAVVMAIPSARPQEPAAFLVAGVSATLPFDERYRDFFGIVRTQIGSAIANARAFAEERRRASVLAELDRAKTAFFSNISHEFRTPLTLMLAPVDDLLARGNGDLPPTVRGELEMVSRNGARLLRLVNSLLDFSRIEAGRIRAVYAPTDLAAYTTELASIFRSATERAGLHLVVDCPALPQAVFVDREMWEKIVLNLVSNAFKFTFAGEIAVRLRARGDAVELAVSDTGVGIPPEEMPRLFERFHRIANLRSRTHEGSGIGLALVQELVRLHGGTVRAESVQNRGSTFTVSVPFGSQHLAVEKVAAQAPSGTAATRPEAFLEEILGWLPGLAAQAHEAGLGPPGVLPTATTACSDERPRILVAEDNADMRDYLVRLLQDRYRVETVPDGEAALAAIRRQRPDLVLSDFMMPQVDGPALVRTLRRDARFGTLPIILLSARAGDDASGDGLAEGPDDYVIKPFSARELLARIEVHLKLARLRREAIDALRHRTEQFETLLNQAPLGVYLIDADFRIVQANPIARQAFCDLPDLIGRDFAEALGTFHEPKRVAEVVGIFRRTLETGESYATSERVELRAGLGSSEDYEWRTDRITLPDGRFGVVCYFRDISAQVKARSEVIQARNRAESASRAKDDFLAALSHELRNPLTPVLMSATELAADASLPREARATLAMIRRNVALEARLIDDLLDLTKLSRGKLALETASVDVHTLLKYTDEIVRAELANRSLELTYALDANEHHVMADSTRLQQVFWNLLKNAVKFTPDGGRIVVRTTTVDRGRIAIAVEDNGRGIAAEALPRIFNAFDQGDLSERHVFGGLGLGLAISKALVDLHGGELVATSEGAGRGATFRVTLDTVSAPVSASRSPFRTAPAPSRLRLLVVDDHRITLDVMAGLLRRGGHEVHPAGSVREALELAAQHKLDAVISDLGLPDGSGNDMMRELRDRYGLPGIALSGFGMEQDRLASAAAGFCAHLVKPVDIGALRSAIAEIGLCVRGLGSVPERETTAVSD